MPLKKPHFTCHNIVAILQAAPKGGTLEEVVSRSQIHLSASALANWIKRGNDDAAQGKHTSYRLFADQWNALYPGTPPRNETARMIEMTKALEYLGIVHEPHPPAPAPSARTTKSSRICECGNSKPPKAPSCDTCKNADKARAA